MLLFVSEDTPCLPDTLHCLQFCKPFDQHQYLDNVIKATASTLDDRWSYDTATQLRSEIQITHGNPFETGWRGKWRLKSNYEYNATIKNIDANRAYAAGVFEKPMMLYDYRNESLNDTIAWLRTSTVTKYSANGNAIEERDAAWIYSAAKFGYNQAVPYLIAQNANEASVLFESFENQYATMTGICFEDGFPVSATVIDTIAHSGKKSVALIPASGTASMNLKRMRLSARMIDQGVAVKFWVREPGDNPISIGRLGIQVLDAANTMRISYEPKRVAKTGQWTLYEAAFKNFGGISANQLFSLKINYLTENSYNLAIDDVRIQPADAQVNCYVYDVRTLKLLTSFDDQHLGLYYQYDAQGKLIRKLVETEQGIRTIAETQYNTPVANRH
jgi:hypothetical protein